MKPRMTRFRRRRRTFLSPGVLSTAVVGLIGILALLWALGFLELGFLPPPSAFARERPEDLIPDRTGQVSFVRAGRALEAYHKISEADLVVTWVNGAAVKPPLIAGENAYQLVGRVLRAHKVPGNALTEDDLFPPGTREGLVAGIPPGKRAMRIDAAKIRGVHGLNLCDCFDVVATMAIDPKELSDVKLGGVYADQLAIEAGVTNWKKQATVKVIVQNGLVVQPVASRLGAEASRSVVGGARVQQKAVDEIVIAVAPEEVAPLTEALAVGADLTCVPRSGHAAEAGGGITPSLTPRTPFSSAARADGDGVLLFQPLTVIESIAGSDRKVVAVPRNDGGAGEER